MSNRHWKFVNDELLRPLNDKLAKRHGAQYFFKVPESSFDWDVEFSAVKDRSGNKVREEYRSAWVQPSLVGPDENTVFNLGVKLHWNAYENTFKGEEVRALFSAVDKVLGLPLKKKDEDAEVKVEDEEEATVTASVKVARSYRIARQLTEDADLGEEMMSLLQRMNDAKLLDSRQLQQVELQAIKDDVRALHDDYRTAALGEVMAALTTVMQKTDEVDVAVMYDIVSRVARSLREGVDEMGKDAAMKLQGVKVVDDTLASLRKTYGGVGDDIEPLFTTMKNVPYDETISSFETAAKALEKMRKKLYGMSFYQTSSPQKVEENVEQLTGVEPKQEEEVK